jgi:hypothetical protein
MAALRLLLGALFAVLVLFQTMSLPGQFAHMAEESPDLAHLRWPLTTITIFWVLCAQVVIVCTWRLLRLVQDDRIFSSSALGWVDVIAGAIAAGWVVLVGLFLVVGFRADDPGPPLALLALVLVTGVVELIVLVLRSLLREATALRSDLDAVI